MFNSQNYRNKYLKYKTKYLESNKSNNYCKSCSIIKGGNSNNIIKAISLFNGDIIKGIVKFQEDLTNDLVQIQIELEGFEPNTVHGFHVHESGDLTKGCDSMCAHFNPFNVTHGDRTDSIRHVGDLGNLYADSSGKVNITFTDHMIKLRGDISNIIGRGLIIHADQDDCGKGHNHTSLTNGNSGKRIGCAIIGYASVC
jgi:Cu-Zn family superoxide dismutase